MTTVLPNFEDHATLVLIIMTHIASVQGTGRASLLPGIAKTASGKLLEAGIAGNMSAWPAQLAPPQSVDPNVDTFPAPVIRLTPCSGFEHYALVDTGSGLSLITEECCKAFPALASQPIRKVFVLASSVMGHLLDMIGCIIAFVHIGDVTISHGFHIMCTSSHPVILGWDFLTQHSATLSGPHAHLQIQDTAVHFSSPQHLVPFQCAAIAASPVTVTPLSEMVIAVSINRGNTKVACAESYATHKRHFGLSCCHLSSHPYDYGRTDLTHHAIHTSDAKPIKLQPYRTSPATQVLLQQEVDKLLEQGIIEESHSPWSAPVVVVQKKDGTHQFWVDYR
ncbi:hypothetical protein AOLI_G00298730 [Acnodon oligacanthus]